MSASDSIGFHFQQLGNSISDMMMRWSSFTDEVPCCKCRALCPVPASTFKWICMNAHDNDPTATKCSQCTSTKAEVISAKRYSPSITCHKCGESTIVADSNFSTNMNKALSDLPESITNCIGRLTGDLQTIGKQGEGAQVDQAIKGVTADANTEGLMSVSEVDAQPTGNCDICSVKASRLCGGCSKSFCDSDAPFVRRLTAKPWAVPRPYCLACADRYDAQYMVASAASPSDSEEAAAPEEAAVEEQ